MREKREQYATHVSKRLLMRQRIFIVIVSVLVIINIVNVAAGKVSVALAIAGFALATAGGMALSRMFNIFWHPEEEKVVAKLDTLGIVLLVVYIAIEAGRKWFLQHWLSGAALNAFGLIVLGGLLLGRFLGTGRKIRNVLTEQNKLD